MGGTVATKSPLERSTVTINIASSFAGGRSLYCRAMRVALLTLRAGTGPGGLPAAGFATRPERATPGQCAHHGHARSAGSPTDVADPLIHLLVHRVARRRRPACPRPSAYIAPLPGTTAHRVVLPHVRDAAVVARLLLLLRELRAALRYRAPACTGGAARSTSRTGRRAHLRVGRVPLAEGERGAVRVRAPRVGRTRAGVIRGVALGAPVSGQPSGTILRVTNRQVPSSRRSVSS